MEVHCIRKCADEDIVYASRNVGDRDNHSIAYCLLGYLCAYYRYYYPVEFITAFLNDAANDDDIKNGTTLARLYGLRIDPPRFGISRDAYAYDKEQGIIAKGIASIKYMGATTGSELYELASEMPKDSKFMDVLLALQQCKLDSRQLDILVRIDFFNAYGNQRELLWIIEMFNFFKQGSAKKVRREKVDGTLFEVAVSNHATAVTKNNEQSKFYTILDMQSILYGCEELIKSRNVPDIGVASKVRSFEEAMGYLGYVSGKQEDRSLLFIREVFPVKRKRDGKQFGYNVLTQSIGSGIESRFTIFNRVFDKEPIDKGDVIRCTGYERDGKYFTMTSYRKIYDDEREIDEAI